MKFLYICDEMIIFNSFPYYNFLVFLMTIHQSEIFPSLFKRKVTLNCRGRLIDISKPQVMGIINLTPDSFYSKSRMKDEVEILKRVEEILKEGGSMVDIGAYSSRPKAQNVSEEEELSRLIPVLKSIRSHFSDVIVSVDTFRADIAEKAIEEGGADIINDISGGEMDSNMFATIARINVPYILMHMQGTPQNMQNNPFYEDVTADISLSLSKRVDILRSLGVNDIIIDPGFGFGKSLNDNYRLLSELDQFAFFELPIMVGFSRKSMIYKLLDVSVGEALNGTTVLNTLALTKGINILRVHDVKEAVECVKLVAQLSEA